MKKTIDITVNPYESPAIVETPEEANKTFSQKHPYITIGTLALGLALGISLVIKTAPTSQDKKPINTPVIEYIQDQYIHYK